MLGDVFVVVIITVVGLVFASVIDGEFLIRGDVLEPFVVEHTAIFVMCSLDLISLLVTFSTAVLSMHSTSKTFVVVGKRVISSSDRLYKQSRY